MKKNNSSGNMKLKINGLTSTISNNFLSVKFSEDASVEKLIIGDKNIVDNLNNKKTFYLDWNGGKEIFSPVSLSIVEYSTNIVHIMYMQKFIGYIEIEYHFIIRSTISGIYNYVIIRNLGNTEYRFSEIRTVYRFDNSLMNRLNNGIIDTKSYLYSYLKNQSFIQDETWQLEDGSYYSKYDLAGYIREINTYGVYGGGYGSWLINFTHEYYSGGPLKQDLLVHQDSLMLNYLTSTHFGTNDFFIPKNWTKMYGPWLIYFNKGKNSNLFPNAQKVFNNEKLNWPFLWLKEKEFQLNRKTIKGKIDNSKEYTVILSSSLHEEFDQQTLGYLYYCNTSNNGKFNISGIRPGKYNIIIYPISGYNCNYIWKRIINIYSDINMDTIKLDDDMNQIIWAIGKTNRKSIDSRFSSENRNYIWHTLVPKDINFYIGKNNVQKDWYYAQTIKGVWKIYFFDTLDSKNRILNIGIAGASNNLLEKKFFKPQLEIYINNILLKKCFYENDKSIYRGSLKSGNFHSEKIYISSEMIITGLNVVSLNLIGGSIIYDTINFTY